MSAAPEHWRAGGSVLLGALVIVTLIGLAVAWGFGARISGAVVAPGVIEVEDSRLVVQHPDGGVVAEILARDGDRVRAGDVLLRLDGTFLRAERAAVESQLAEVIARRARLIAERDGARAPVFDIRPTQAGPVGADLSEQVDGQAALFHARYTSFTLGQRQLSEQQHQIGRQIEGTRAQIAGLERQRLLVSEELADLQSLFAQGLVPRSRLSELERAEARLDGEIGRLVAAVSEARARISEIELERLQRSDRRREEAIARLSDLAYSAIDLEERRSRLAERLTRLDIRAPATGTVFASQVGSAGAVLSPGAPILWVVPDDRPHVIRARIEPAEIDRLHTGQPARLVFPGAAEWGMGDHPGEVLRLSPDVKTDPGTGQSFYEAILIADTSAAPELVLLPGMPVEVFVTTEARSPLAYLVEPLARYLSRAFREG